MKVKFLPQDVELEIQQGQTVMDLAHKNNIPIRSTCNGMPSCAECRVKVTDGDWNTNPPSRKELGLIGTGYYIDQRRLSCQMLCFGDITVDTTEQVEKSAEGPVTKKFLTKVHKETAAQSHSLGGVMLEENNQLLHELQKDVPDQPSALTAASLDESRKNKHRDRDRGRGRGDQRGGGQGGGNRDERGGGNQRRDGRPGGGQNRDVRGDRTGQMHNPAGGNIPVRAPHPKHINGTASPEMSAGADVGGERGDHGPGGEGGQRRRRRRGGRGRNRGGRGGGEGRGPGSGGGGHGGGGNSGGGSH